MLEMRAHRYLVKPFPHQMLEMRAHRYLVKPFPHQILKMRAHRYLVKPFPHQISTPDIKDEGTPIPNMSFCKMISFKTYKLHTVYQLLQEMEQKM